MRVKLLKPARIHHNAGEVVDVSPAEFNFLVSLGVAVPEVDKTTPETPEAPKTAKKTENRRRK